MATTCIDNCIEPGGQDWTADGVCDDGNNFPNCQWGSDCTDCEPRVIDPPTSYAFDSSLTSLKSAVVLWETDRLEATRTYGYINTWDTSRVTDMNHLFHGYCNTFDDDIGDWDTSRVTDMGDMFDECYVFDQVCTSHVPWPRPAARDRG